MRDGELPYYVYRISNRKTSCVCLRQNSDVCAKGTHPIAFWGLHALPGKEGKDCLSRTYPAVSRFQVFNMHGLGPQATVLEPQAHPYQQASLLKLQSCHRRGWLLSQSCCRATKIDNLILKNLEQVLSTPRWAESPKESCIIVHPNICHHCLYRTWFLSV